ncbi:guanylyl cyclase-activating protein 2-like isoform X2 [Tigriopus californicus]|uniref:guanylyl cyclase-activating protein 2-like isoform X2 n=1 Tax=Tigriopus californicus TaxID=6832 RepID=UPI0027DA890E|nr:guanylyl cyclase-activating protein 2-like isoform X2 [Tigriopus californicus]XP_059089824.1 guanylyl cyclase-activating protein 2-like isoform X2 [Tigriopus californicus]XP_059089825.1 guanylyl cyclase-activating protein 2-like isoform X2 [Tigriopus californicus]
MNDKSGTFARNKRFEPKKEKEFKPMSNKLSSRNASNQSTRRKKPVKNAKNVGGRKTPGSLQVAEVIVDKKLDEHIATLSVKSTMPEKEIRERYKQFVVDVPGQRLTKERFIELSGEALGEEAQSIADAIFKVFDENKSGDLDFVEYMMAVNSTQLETPEDKLQWIFKMYDKDCSGNIETEELVHMFQTLFDMSDVKIDATQMTMLTNDVMQTLDEDGNGLIDMHEFVSGSMKTPFIYNILCPK